MNGAHVIGLDGSALGVVAGLATACLWTGTALCFEAASRRMGSLSVNVLRLAVAAVLFGALSFAQTSRGLPSASSSAWAYLGLSGLVGFVVGDVMLFQAFVLIGARLSMLLYSSVPLMTALWGFSFLGERMSIRALAGMALTVVGIALAVGTKPSRGDAHARAPTSRRLAGVLFALGGSAGQAAGLLLAKHGAAGLDSFAATHIRVLAGLAGFAIIVIVTGNGALVVGRLRMALSASGASAGDPGGAARSMRVALGLLSLGAVLGPFLGVSLGLLSTQLLPAGTAATLMSIVPVLLVPVSAFVFRERVSLAEIVGAVAAVAGVAVLVAA